MPWLLTSIRWPFSLSWERYYTWEVFSVNGTDITYVYVPRFCPCLCLSSSPKHSPTHIRPQRAWKSGHLLWGEQREEERRGEEKQTKIWPLRWAWAEWWSSWRRRRRTTINRSQCRCWCSTTTPVTNPRLPWLETCLASSSSRPKSWLTSTCTSLLAGKSAST